MAERLEGEVSTEGGPNDGDPRPLSPEEFRRKLWMALLFEEEVVANEYRRRIEGLDDVQLREVLGEMVEEAAEHKGELLALIERLEDVDAAGEAVEPVEDGPSTQREVDAGSPDVGDASPGAGEPMTEAETILREMLEVERAAAAFYADLLEQVQATPELSGYVDDVADMAEEEAEHAEMVQKLLRQRGIEVVVAD